MEQTPLILNKMLLQKFLNFCKFIEKFTNSFFQNFFCILDSFKKIEYLYFIHLGILKF